MLQPKKRKHQKDFRGRMKGIALRGSKVAYGEFGLQALECDWINGRQIEAARKAIVRNTKRRGKVWIKVFPHKPITEKNSEAGRGKGKGPVKEYVVVVRPGLILFEIGGLPEGIAKKSLNLGAQKLSIKTRVVNKN